MTVDWSDPFRNREQLAEFYDSLPESTGVTIRSVYLDKRGPALALRLDLPVFADRPLVEWVENGCDRVQCQMKFLALDDVVMRDLKFPVVGSVVMVGQEDRRVGVQVVGGTGELRFASSDSLTVGHVSAFRSGGGADSRQFFASKLDRRRFGDRLPSAHEKGFYG